MVLFCFIFRVYNAEHYLHLTLTTSLQRRVQTLPGQETLPGRTPLNPEQNTR